MTSTRINRNDLNRFDLSKNTLSRYSNPLSLVVDVKETIEKICVIHFGIRSGLLDELLMDSVVSTIICKFKTLTTQDLISSFERIEIKNDSWKNITKRDLIEPIQNWWNKKEEIRLEFEKYQTEINEIEQSEAKIQEFKDQSIVVYVQSLKDETWHGTIFQANAIYKEVMKGISNEDRKEIWYEAEIKKNKQDIEHDKNPDKFDFSNIGLTAKRIFRELIVIEGVKRKIEL